MNRPPLRSARFLDQLRERIRYKEILSISCLGWIRSGISIFGIFNVLHDPNLSWMQNIAVIVFFLLSGCVMVLPIFP